MPFISYIIHLPPTFCQFNVLLVAWQIAVQFEYCNCSFVYILHCIFHFSHVYLVPLSHEHQPQEWFMCNLQDSVWDVSIFSKAISVRPHSVTFIHASLSSEEINDWKSGWKRVFFYSSDFFWWLFLQKCHEVTTSLVEINSFSEGESFCYAFLGRCTLCTMNGLISRFAHFMEAYCCSSPFCL